MEEEITLNKKELVEQVYESLSSKFKVTKKDITSVYDEIFTVLENELANGNSINLTGIGKFYIKEQAARTGVNPKTRQTIQIPAKRVVKFKISKKLKLIAE
jgi:DNA-binding protein HU-beta